jgi:hypothetical protein
MAALVVVYSTVHIEKVAYFPEPCAHFGPRSGVGYIVSSVPQTHS